MYKKAERHTGCLNCRVRRICLADLGEEDCRRVEALVIGQRKIRRGATVFQAGDTFAGLHAIRTGFFKTVVTLDNGQDQVTGFKMAGDTLGLDGISGDLYTSSAVALEDADVCVLPFDGLSALSREFVALQHFVHRLMGREIVREHGVMVLLGSLRTEGRLASFLLNLAQRLQVRGYSASELVLRMSRDEIGSFLGLRIETVSRAFSRLVAEGLVAVNERQVSILDTDALKRLVHPKPRPDGKNRKLAHVVIE